MAPNILVICKLYWPEGGGGELATKLIIEHVLSVHYNTTIVSGTRNPSTAGLEGCKYVWWPALSQRFKPLEWIEILARTRELRSLIETADVIYVSSHTVLPLIMEARRMNPRARIIAHVHGYQPLTYTSILKAGGKPNLANDLEIEKQTHGSILRTSATGLMHYLNRINQLALHSADKVICVSNRQYEILRDYIPSLRTKMSVIYNLLPSVPDRLKDPSQRPSVIYAGGGSYIKGYNTFVKAFLELITTRGRREALIYSCGDLGSREKSLLQLEATHTENIRVLKRVSHTEFLKLCSNSWASLFASIAEEPLPYAVSESMLSGTIPIASRVGGVPEIVNGTLAEKFLFEPTDMEGLLDRMETVLSFSKEELIDVGARLKREILSKFNLEKSREELLKLLGAAASEN